MITTVRHNLERRSRQGKGLTGCFWQNLGCRYVLAKLRWYSYLPRVVVWTGVMITAAAALLWFGCRIAWLFVMVRVGAPVELVVGGDLQRLCLYWRGDRQLMLILLFAAVVYAADKRRLGTMFEGPRPQRRYPSLVLVR